MKPRFYGARLLVTALAALTLSGPACAGKQVPFKGTSSGIVTVTGVSYPFVSASVVGEGVATHLGRFTVTGQVVIDVTTGIPIGPWTLTAANGDMLFTTFVGYGIDPFHGGGVFTIVGGTGRFQGATGSYTQLITFGDAPGYTTTSYSDVLAGTISSPGSNQ